MRLLLFSDLHANMVAARALVERAAEADVLVGAGDFGVTRRHVGACFDVLKQIDRPAVLVAGNNESLEELLEAARPWPSAHVLHGSGVEISGVKFFGIGGGIPVTPFGAWSYDFTEDQARSMLRDCPEGCVLVTHSPPKGAVDVGSRGKGLGSEALRETVFRVRPALVVCGHIHDSSGRHEFIEKTPVVNAGPGGIDWIVGENEPR